MKKKLVLVFLVVCFITPGWSNFNFDYPARNADPGRPINLNLAMTDEIGGGKSNWTFALLCPGLGLYRVTQNKRDLLYMPACYGLVGGGIGVTILGKVENKKYLESKNPAEIDTHAAKAALYSTAGFLMTSAGIGLWIFQAGWTYIYGSYNDIYRERNANWNDKVSFNNSGFGYDPMTNSVSLSTTIQF